MVATLDMKFVGMQMRLLNVKVNDGERQLARVLMKEVVVGVDVVGECGVIGEIFCRFETRKDCAERDRG